MRIFDSLTKRNYRLFFSEIVFNRGCCSVIAGSSVCPPGDADQEVSIENVMTKRIVRCNDHDLCNTEFGDPDAEIDDDAAGAPIVVLDGRAAAAKVVPFVAVVVTSAILKLLTF